MSEYTTTPNLGLLKPTVDADEDLWGDHLNANFDTLDGVLSVSTGIFLPLAGGQMQGMLSLFGSPAAPFDAATKSYVDTAIASIPPPAAGATLTVADTPPALTQGALWFDAVSTQLFVGYVDPTGPGQWLIAVNQSAGGAYLPMSGGSLTGYLSLFADPTAPLHAAPKRYVDNAINMAGNYLGTWAVASNTPNISAGGSISNANYVATTTNPATPETVPVGVPGIAGMTVANGDRIIWAAGLGVWQILRNAGVTLAAADARYYPLATNPSGYQTAANVTTALAPYAPLAAPVFTGDARAVTPTPGDNDTSIATTAFVQTAVAAAPAAANNVGRNLLHNALFNVAQRGAGPWTTSGAYTADRWVTVTISDTISFSMVALTDADRAAIADEAATSCLQNTFTGNAAAGALSAIVQKIEAVRRLAGKTVTLSFWARATTGTPKLGANIVQNFGTGGSPSASIIALSTGLSWTLSTTWTRYSGTVAIPSAAGKTFGTAGDDQTQVSLYYSSGATNNQVCGNIGVQSGTIQLWGVQLEIGSVATPLEKPDPQQDLAKCQRFYQQMSLDWAGQVSSGVGYRTGGTISPPMRATPTVILNNNQSTGFGAVTTAVTFGAQPSGQLLQASATASATGFAALSALFNLSADL